MVTYLNSTSDWLYKCDSSDSHLFRSISSAALRTTLVWKVQSFRASQHTIQTARTVIGGRKS